MIWLLKGISKGLLFQLVSSTGEKQTRRVFCLLCCELCFNLRVFLSPPQRRSCQLSTLQLGHFERENMLITKLHYSKTPAGVTSDNKKHEQLNSNSRPLLNVHAPETMFMGIRLSSFIWLIRLSVYHMVQIKCLRNHRRPVFIHGISSVSSREKER